MRDDTYYPNRDRDDDEVVERASQYRPLNRHKTTGLRAIRNIRMQLENDCPAPAS